VSQETLYLHFPQWQGSSHRDGPSLIRGSELIAEALNYLPFERIDVSRREASETLSNIRAKADLLNHAKYVRQIIEKTHPKRIVTLGGDCGVDLLPITYLHKRYGSDLAVIWIDAHADLNTPASSSSQAFHGMVLRACLGEGDKD
jgi:arginase